VQDGWVPWFLKENSLSQTYKAKENKYATQNRKNKMLKKVSLSMDCIPDLKGFIRLLLHSLWRRSYMYGLFQPAVLGLFLPVSPQSI